MPIRFAHRPGLVVYLTVGDPDLVTTRAIALAAISVLVRRRRFWFLSLAMGLVGGVFLVQGIL